MRISDWSSDVCSSDLKDLAVGLKERAERIGGARGPFVIAIGGRRGGICRGHRGPGFGADAGIIVAGELLRLGRHVEILPSRWRRRIDARARKSVVSGKSVSVRVDLGGRRHIKKKKIKKSKTEKFNN